jgi:hypothetical protein
MVKTPKEPCILKYRVIHLTTDIGILFKQSTGFMNFVHRLEL